ncbi:MAG: hypothetical protein ACOCU8_01360 [Patescibacteria group bacterium]
MEALLAKILFFLVSNLLSYFPGWVTGKFFNYIFKHHPSFATPEQYFKESEPELTNLSVTIIDRFNGYLSDIESFLDSDDKDFLLIYGPAGHGKSHLLREASFRFKEDQRILIVKPGSPLREDLLSAIGRGGKYLIILDDAADKNEEELLPFLKFLNRDRSRNNVKIIFAFRSAGLSFVEETITRQRLRSAGEKIEITSWTADELSTLLHRVSGLETIDAEEVILGEYPNPYLIVLMGKKLKNEPIENIQAFRERITQDVLSDTRSVMRGVNLDIENLLTQLAMISGFNEQDARILEELASRTNSSVAVVEDSLKRLIRAGVLKQVGRTIRFNADIIGDIFLSFRMTNFTQDQVTSLITEWTNINPERIFGNLGSAYRDNDATQVVGAMNAIVTQWITEIDRLSIQEIKNRIDWLSRVSHFAANTCFDFLFSVLSRVEREELDLSTDSFGPLLKSLISFENEEGSLFSAILRISVSVKVGMYDNYKSLELMQDYMSPLISGPRKITSRIQLLRNRIASADSVELKLISDGLSEVLRASHKTGYSYGNKMTFGERALRNINEVQEMRSAAMEALKELIVSGRICLAIPVIESIGSTHRGQIDASAVPLANNFPEERRQAKEVIRNLLENEQDNLSIHELSKIENLLILCWARMTQGTEASRDLLHLINRTPDYLAYRSIAAHEYYIEDFTSLEATAPQDERWRWFVDTVMSNRWDRSGEDFISLATSLDNSHEDTDSIISLLESILPEEEKHHYPPAMFLRQWVSVAQQKFLSLRREAWDRVPEFFKGDIDEILADTNSEHLNALADELITNVATASYQQTSRVIRLSNKLDADKQRTLLETVAKEGSPDAKTSLSFDLHWVFKERDDLDLFADVILLLLEDDNISDRVIDNLSFLLHHSWERLQNLFPDRAVAIANRLRKILVKVKQLSWNENELLKYACTDSASIIDLLVRRIERAKELKDYTYDAIPFEGIKTLPEYIDSLDDFKILFNRLLDEEDEDSIFGMDVGHLVDSFAGKTTNGVSLLEQYISDSLVGTQYAKALRALRFLPLGPSSIEIHSQCAVQASEAGHYSMVEEVFLSKLYPRGGWSSTVGEDPPALVGIRDAFISLRDQSSPGQLRNLFNRCAEGVERQIEDHRRENEELQSGR